jgi:hypothetical protein
MQEVLKKHNAIIAEIKKTNQENNERIMYLTSLNTLLQAAIRDLRNDLSAKSA